MKLELTSEDRVRAIKLDGGEAEGQRIMFAAVARVLAETDWPALEPDERAELLDTLAFTAGEELATLDTWTPDMALDETTVYAGDAPCSPACDYETRGTAKGWHNGHCGRMFCQGVNVPYRTRHAFDMAATPPICVTCSIRAVEIGNPLDALAPSAQRLTPAAFGPTNYPCGHTLQEAAADPNCSYHNTAVTALAG